MTTGAPGTSREPESGVYPAAKKIAIAEDSYSTAAPTASRILGLTIFRFVT